jgi:serine/threonine-protein kinase RsbW
MESSFALQVRLEEPAVFAALDQLMAVGATWDLGESTLGTLRLVLEELMLNVCHHSGLGANATMDVTLRRDGTTLQLRIEDCGPSFDPFSRATPDLELAIEEREIGGLGIHFVKCTTDRQRWSRQAGKNVVEVEWDLPQGAGAR